MTPGAPLRVGTVRATCRLELGGLVSGRVHLGLPANHPSVEQGECCLKCNSGLELSGMSVGRMDSHTVIAALSGQDYREGTIEFSGRLRFEGLQTGYVSDSEWFLPSWSGWFPHPEGVETHLELTLPPDLSSVLPGHVTMGRSEPVAWTIPANSRPTLVVGRWVPASWSAGVTALPLPAEPFISTLCQVGAVLEQRYGAWPFGCLNVAQIAFLPTEALSLPGLVLLNPELMTGMGSDQLYLAGLLAHEMAHQWFGNLLPVSRPDELWLMEALAEWERVRYCTVAFGVDAGNRIRLQGLDLYRQVAARMDMGALNLIDLRNRDPVAFDGLAYGPGLSLLWTLSAATGGELFDAALRELIRTRTELSVSNLCRTLQALSPEVDWSQFCDEALAKKGVRLPYGRRLDGS